jgi:hypothetical protein
MKAAHRKELHTNVLADRMGKLYESVKAGPRTTSALVWLFVLLALVAAVSWKFWNSTNPEDESARWVYLRQATHDPDPDVMARDLRELVDQNAATVQSRAARYQEARLKLRKGQESLLAADAKTRSGAVEKIQSARNLYEQLARETKAFPVLHQEALLGVAKTEETLAGISVDEKAPAYGNLDRALAFYQKLVQLNLRLLGKQASEENAVATLEQLVQDQLRGLGQDVPADQALAAFEKLAETHPEKFTGSSGVWRDLSYTGRLAAQAARNLQPGQRETLQKFYAELNRMTGPKEETPRSQ